MPVCISKFEALGQNENNVYLVLGNTSQFLLRSWWETKCHVPSWQNCSWISQSFSLFFLTDGRDSSKPEIRDPKGFLNLDEKKGGFNNLVSPLYEWINVIYLFFCCLIWCLKIKLGCPNNHVRHFYYWYSECECCNFWNTNITAGCCSSHLLRCIVHMLFYQLVNHPCITISADLSTLIFVWALCNIKTWNIIQILLTFKNIVEV